MSAGQEYINNVVELREELNKSQDQIVHLNRVVAETTSELNKLSADIDRLHLTKEVRNNTRFYCLCYLIMFQIMHDLNV